MKEHWVMIDVLSKTLASSRIYKSEKSAISSYNKKSEPYRLLLINNLVQPIQLKMKEMIDEALFRGLIKNRFGNLK